MDTTTTTKTKARGSKTVKPNFENRTIWTGDNLDILRGLNSASVDLIYLDPPFNSNRDYAAPVGSEAAGAAFKDTWTLDDLDIASVGLLADTEPALADYIRTASSSHSKGMQSYLTMMAVRLLEMRRVLKLSGWIYLHCDDTASHYLKQVMDCVFGKEAYRADITWKRTTAQNAATKQWGRVADSLLAYAMPKADFKPQFAEHDPEYIAKFYKHNDNDGRGAYSLDNLASPQFRINGLYDWQGYEPPANGWRCSEEVMQKLHDQGRLHYPTNPNGSPDYTKRIRRKRYLSESAGKPVGNVWTDINPVSPHAKERVGYPTQKPLALLDRIIQASTNKGDVVLDPFAGCATACVSAHKLDRRWIGIDLSPKAVGLVNLRLKRQDVMGEWFHSAFVTARTDIPKRTDIDELPYYKTHKHTLYGKQEGRCAGCKQYFPFRNFTIDHIIPRSKGGADHKDNLQLLCGHCNSTKGNRPMEYLMAALAERMINSGTYSNQNTSVGANAKDVPVQNIAIEGLAQAVNELIAKAGSQTGEQTKADSKPKSKQKATTKDDAPNPIEHLAKEVARVLSQQEGESR